MFLPQMIYNGAFFGGPLTTGYQVLSTSPDGLFSTLYLSGGLAKVWTRFGLWLLPGFLLLIGVVGFGLVFLWRRDRIGALVVGLLIGSYAVVYSLLSFSWNGSMLRYLMPIYPAVAVLAAAATMEILSLRQQRTRAINPHL
jgi:CHASE2 domain-containing sensor protein